ncbi:hypothetical protein [Acetobacter okinawensis]|uniref:hypothetical protein n=1 Tax=Acetobacter okinawensis TaxID=1076594 RepID=UPI000A3A7C3C|nr:hypothetical protein [Acetobacter okinawensis]
MDASNLTDVFHSMLSSSALRHMSAPCSVVQHPDFERPVCVQPDGAVLCGPQRLGSAQAWFFARLALEVSALVRVLPHGMAHGATCAIPAGADMQARHRARLLLAAARVTACAWSAQPWHAAPRPQDAPEAMPCTWGAAMAGSAVPSAPQLAQCVVDMACYVAPALRPDAVDAQDLHNWACSVWAMVQPAEWLVVQGGDERLDPARQTGLNRYGCQPFPRYGELDFSSSTASSPTLPAARAIHQAAARLTRLAVEGQVGVEAVEQIKAFLASFYQLDGAGRVVLAPSGTDCALAATALMGLASARLTTLLPGVEETGSGVPLATCGRHFASRTARGQAVHKGTLLEGFAPDAQHVALPLRGRGGVRVSDDALFAACARQITRAMQEGRRVLLYVLHVSKTWQLVLPASRVQALCALYPTGVDVLVDACQARLRPESVRQYVQWGWAVMVTGSKFFTGPPFSGALFLPDGWLDRLHHNSLPAGLAAYATRAEWPDLPATRSLPAGLNAGLFLRWSGAQAEMAAFAAVPDAQKYTRLHQFVVEAKAALLASPLVRLLPSVPPSAQPGVWDSLPSIVAFVVLLDGRALDLGQAKRLHGWLLADLSADLPMGLPAAERALAALPCHVGQPVALTTEDGVEEGLGALRVSASARHISGTGGLYGAAEGGVATPEHPVVRMLGKLALILRYWPELSGARQAPCAQAGEAGVGHTVGAGQVEARGAGSLRQVMAR